MPQTIVIAALISALASLSWAADKPTKIEVFALAFEVTAERVAMAGRRCTVWIFHSLRMDRSDASGECPGRIHKHRAVAVRPHRIRVWGGMVLTGSDSGGRNNRTRLRAQPGPPTLAG
jgi:hypothetical protein